VKHRNPLPAPNAADLKRLRNQEDDAALQRMISAFLRCILEGVKCTGTAALPGGAGGTIDR
jgi:hypothetical protein